MNGPQEGSLYVGIHRDSGGRARQVQRSSLGKTGVMESTGIGNPNNQSDQWTTIASIPVAMENATGRSSKIITLKNLSISLATWKLLVSFHQSILVE